MWEWTHGGQRSHNWPNMSTKPCLGLLYSYSTISHLKYFKRNNMPISQCNELNMYKTVSGTSSVVDPTTKQNLVILSSKVTPFYLPRVKPVDFILIVLPCLCPLLQPIKKPVSVSLCTATMFSKALIMFNECNQMATIVLNIAPFIIKMLHL